MKGYVVTYMGELQGFFPTEEEANAYSDKFGGVYGVHRVDFESVLHFALDNGYSL